jgi:translation elongation factor EF-1beta
MNVLFDVQPWLREIDLDQYAEQLKNTLKNHNNFDSGIL